MDPSVSDTAPAVLTDLITAGLVSHEMIGDPRLLGSEAATLRVLCGLVGGSIYRLDPFHFAFRAGPGDLAGQLADIEPSAWTGALEAALQAELGAEAVWLNATDLLSDAEAPLDQTILLLRAQAAAVAAGLESATPAVQAVINARYAVECARLAAAADPGSPLARRLAVIETRQEELLEMLSGREEATALLVRLNATLAVVLQRLDAQAEVLHRHIAREDAVASKLAEIGELAGDPGRFQESLGLTLAEFLARLERRAEEERAGVLRVPQFS